MTRLPSAHQIMTIEHTNHSLFGKILTLLLFLLVLDLASLPPFFDEFLLRDRRTSDSSQKISRGRMKKP